MPLFFGENLVLLERFSYFCSQKQTNLEWNERHDTEDRNGSPAAGLSVGAFGLPTPDTSFSDRRIPMQ